MHALHYFGSKGHITVSSLFLFINFIVILILHLSARLFVLIDLIGGVMSHLDFQYISKVAWSYICVYRPVFPVWRCKTLKSAW